MIRTVAAAAASGSRRRFAIGVSLAAAVHAAVLAGLRTEPVAAHNPITTTVTWTREIAAILERRCVSCHRPGGFAGFSLTTYQDARPWAVAIKELVLAGDMPPWGAAAGIGHFANDRRLTRHELEIVAAWVDGGAPYAPGARTPAFAAAAAQDLGPAAIAIEPLSGGVAIPLAPATIGAAAARTASVTLQLPVDMTLTAWTFEPGVAPSAERVDLELGTRWVGTWTPGEPTIEYAPDSGVPLGTSALFTARITYRAAPAPAVDHSRLRVWMAREARPKIVREVTVVRSWRAPGAVDLLAMRPAREDGAAQVFARFAGGRVEALGVLDSPRYGPHPIYRLARPLALPAGARIETTAPVRLLYSAGATRTVNPNVSRRSRR